MTIDEMAEMAKQVFLLTGHHAPEIVVEGSDDIAAMTLTNLSDQHDQKCRDLARASAWLGQNQRLGPARRIFFAHEAWMSRAKDGRLPERRPSEDPGRTEVLIVLQLEVATGDLTHGIYEIVRVGGTVDLVAQNIEGAQIVSHLPQAILMGYEAGRAATQTSGDGTIS